MNDRSTGPIANPALAGMILLGAIGVGWSGYHDGASGRMMLGLALLILALALGLVAWRRAR
jgi:hypothetical protein